MLNTASLFNEINFDPTLLLFKHLLTKMQILVNPFLANDE